MLTRDEVTERVHERIEEMMKLREIKGHDYATETDGMANYNFAKLTGGRGSQSIWYRIGEKVVRMNQYMSGRDLMVRDETPRSTLLDIALQCILLSIQLEDERDEVVAVKNVPQTGSL